MHVSQPFALIYEVQDVVVTGSCYFWIGPLKSYLCFNASTIRGIEAKAPTVYAEAYRDFIRFIEAKNLPGGNTRRTRVGGVSHDRPDRSWDSWLVA